MTTEKTGQTERDMKAIRTHVISLFEAFLRKDREAIRRGHTIDWRGFQVKSKQLVRGIDEYMEAADQALKSFSGVRYEVKDIEIQVYNDIAVVYYVAHWWFKEGEEEKLLPLRSVDVYRRERGGWNQSGSNISVLPQ